jgi:ribosomal protein S6--L-glutamate ligase
MHEVVVRLQALGVKVDLVVPEAALHDVASLQPRHDLYVLKSKSPLALSLAGALTEAGARVVNTFWSSNLARDKIAATAVLAAFGVPVPPSWAAGKPAHLRTLLHDRPLWVKPQRGSRGAGVRRLNGPHEIDDLDAPQDPYGLPLPLFAQHEAPSNGRDLKVYVVGSHTWAITRPFPALTVADKQGQPVPLPENIHACALKVGKALGLEIYGVDFLTAHDKFWVVDVNAFPGFKGVPEAPRCIARHLFDRTRDLREQQIASPASQLEQTPQGKVM